MGVGAGGALAGSGCGKPKNKLGISSETETFFWAAPFFWREKNNGARTFSGNSSSIPSWAETATAADLIHERKSRQEKITRPRFNAGSTRLTGNATWALFKSNSSISVFKSSG